MTTKIQIARDQEIVKQQLVLLLVKLVDGLFTRLDGARMRDVEIQTWGLLLELGRVLLAAQFGWLCRRSMEADVEKRGLRREDVSVRLDRNYITTCTTTMGEVSFPLFAYRYHSGPATITRTPSRQDVVRLTSRCRSSELCLEWESRLGSQLAFRRAQEALAFFTHGAVKQEDTTIAAHMVCVGAIVGRPWLYRTPEQIRTILDERAMRDRETGRPVLYLSTDGHMLRRYDDDTWVATWKNANGLRLWCIDKVTSGVIHLGGEYTWGDCNKVAGIVADLIATGILPRDGDYGAGMLAVLVVLTDGMPWIECHVLSQLSWAIAILDIYHALQHLALFLATLFGKGSAESGAWYKRLAENLRKGAQPSATFPTKRKGHKKVRRANIVLNAPSASAQETTEQPPDAGLQLIMALYAEHATFEVAAEPYDALIAYYDHNQYRMHYFRYRARGFQIGSGAMESLHRTASQARLKIPGARWLASTAQAIFNLRMLSLVGRWDEFWAQPDLTDQLLRGFQQRTPA
jgi:hypothetical protein